MVMFISAYARQCDKEVDEDNPIVQAVNSIINGADISTNGDDFEDEPEDEEEPAPKPKSPKKEAKPVVAAPPPRPAEPTDEELFGEVEAEPAGLPQSALSSLAGMVNRGQTGEPPRVSGDVLEDLPLQEEEGPEQQEVPDFFGGAPMGLADLFRSVNGGDLDADPLAGMYGEGDGGEDSSHTDRAQSILLGDED